MADPIALLSEPVELPCGLRLPNRLAKAAMAENMAEGDLTVPGRKFANVYSAWAEGDWGMIMSGNVQVDPAHLGSPNDLTLDYSRLEDPKYIAAWAEFSRASQKKGAPAIIQINHPGRQSPVGAGNRGFFSQAVAPSEVPLSFGPGILAGLVRKLVFGTPRALSTVEISEIISKFVKTAVHIHKSGFKGIELHVAHGYLLAQFLSPKTNLRTDKYGGNASKRVAIVVEIIRAIRDATPSTFCVGIKLNSADVQGGDSLEDTLTQIKEIVDVGIDFVEISGGTYEKARMIDGDSHVPSERTQKREAFFMDFAQQVRKQFPSTILMVTGGFRTRQGMADAIATGACDIVGLGRPAADNPRLPRDLFLNTSISTAESTVELPIPKQSSLLNALGLQFVGAGAETAKYGAKIRALATFVISSIGDKKTA